MGAGAASVFLVEMEAGSFAWEGCLNGAEPQWAHTPAPPETATRSRTASEILLSLRRNMVLKTPCVKERIEAETDCAAANRVAALRVHSTRGVATAGGESEQPGGGEDREGYGDPTTLEPRPQELPAARQPPADRADRPAQEPGGLFVRPPLEVTEHDRSPILVGKPTQLFMEQWPEIELVDVLRSGRPPRWTCSSSPGR